MTVIRVGTRQSQLALTQTQQVVDRLKELHPHIDFELVPYKTKGDRLSQASLQEIGGKGVFVKDIERALLDGEVDMAVHSLKDVPALLAEGCVLGAIPKREDVRDCLITRYEGESLETLPVGARVGTSSLRRQLQIQDQRPDVRCLPLRGNIDTRLKKLADGEYDAIVLAMAGLRRMGWHQKEGFNIQPLDPAACLPAISQGALGIECRQEDQEVLDILASIHDPETAACVSMERSFLGLMNADCTFPIGALGQKLEDGYRFDAMLADKEGVCLRVSLNGQLEDRLPEAALMLLQTQGAEGPK